jgi:hypothetical protein
VCCTVNNRSPNNGSGCFSPRAHRPSGRASFKASTHRHALKTAAPRLKSPGVGFIAKVSEGRSAAADKITLYKIKKRRSMLNFGDSRSS